VGGGGSVFGNYFTKERTSVQRRGLGVLIELSHPIALRRTHINTTANNTRRFCVITYVANPFKQILRPIHEPKCMLGNVMSLWRDSALVFYESINQQNMRCDNVTV